MNVEMILKSIKNYDFEKLNRCFDNPHSTMIGLWSYWWLTVYKNGYVRDGAPGVDTKDGKKFADLMFCDENETGLGAIEVESKYHSYDVDVDNLFYYPSENKKMNFLMIHVWAWVDKKGNYLNKKATQEVRNTLKLIQKKSLHHSQYWAVIISKWTSDGYIGHEWIVYKKGKEFKEFKGKVGKGEYFNRYSK